MRRFLATESLWKIMKSAFYFTLKALFVLKILSFYLDVLKVNFKIYDVTILIPF